MTPDERSRSSARGHHLAMHGADDSPLVTQAIPASFPPLFDFAGFVNEADET